ncbi:penicillin acylase family protein [Pseudomonas aeruginosa]
MRTARRVAACCPPCWDGRYDWDGCADPILHPSTFRTPQQGWLGTANHRTVQPGYGAQLSNSWYYPSAPSAPVAQLAGASKSHDTQSMIRMRVRPDLGCSSPSCKPCSTIPAWRRRCARPSNAFAGAPAGRGRPTTNL